MVVSRTKREKISATSAKVESSVKIKDLVKSPCRSRKKRGKENQGQSGIDQATAERDRESDGCAICSDEFFSL